MAQRLIFGSDHAGFHLKMALTAWASAKGFEVEDLGCKDENSVHYPEYGRKVAQEIASGRAEKGVLICGTGIGMSITANRFHGVRAALCHDVKTAQLSREHNNANILVLGARVLSESLAVEMLKAWLDTPFAGGRHQDRLEMLDQPTGL
ncbi:MAG: ribose 5-phosphate isomerase B [Candidatus Lambdaproteobacteria bacterium RIFOXYD1_FULL_56_27]|uniref:Ribose 5-phosphate isomerase B n=1 Tax=Candidatus Lambdaproteobacteria bacterium RIFOXYD2_FULL_56_26 TaxID=1817773 RepID=A0A1F6H3F5_9PROT|nr:MAG: ribose 5-phosphate isomerase B [Candidatus Lambdaproteobacteria bacterium RIFOXYC1_FULL_56_13]OGH04901.1 MAG: ribose 5-phosphate isomerase B [Candidatus Lambdaproteobacteria bacterium RIFOXYD2_FULL_56_26]OGH09366.1 MAG: ribose 5-phosphate isomerase B [Candidatus Lambdaproteobacteria bacterium RIFOXYD1_FULL_56_27]